LGLFLNYIQAQEIDVYYNVLFADHQNIFIYAAGVIIFGYLFLFYNTKRAVIIFVISLAVVNLTQISSVGKSVGEMMFAQENKIISSGKHTYIGTVVYEGRDKLWFYDDELKEIITLEKDKINE
jgi:hypothetical protein